MKRSKILFLFLMLLVLILGFNSVNATDVSYNDNNTLLSSSSDNIHIDYNSFEINENTGGHLNQNSNNIVSSDDDSKNIYVSNDGNDGNDGTKDKPLATIGKAVSISSDGYTINIAKGTYTENINLPASKSLSFVGESNGNVILKSTSSNVFTLTETGSTLKFINLTFTGISSTSGSSAGIKIGGDSPIEIINCTFKDISAKYGAMQIYTSSNALIDNCIISNIYVSGSGGSGIYLSGSGIYNIYNTKISNIALADSLSSSTTAFLRAALYLYSSGGTLNVVNSSISDVVGPSRSIIEIKGKSTLINSSIYNNKIYPTAAGYHGENIVDVSSSSAKLTVKSSAFINNTAKVYLFSNDSGELEVTYSVIINNNVSSYTTKSTNLKYNWWGTNSKKFDSLENWIILSASSNNNEINVNENTIVTADFNHYTTDGSNSFDLTGGYIYDGTPVDCSVNLGSLDASTKFTSKGIAEFTYTGVQTGLDKVSFKSANETKEISISVKGSSVINKIYVAINGNDDNPGTEDEPVATLSKAIELASKGQKQIIINEGTYNENNLDISSDLNITGQGKVIIDGDQSKIFTITNSNVLIENITFTNAKSNYGAIIKSDYSNVILKGVEVYSNSATDGVGKTISLFYNKQGTLNITNSKFYDNDGDGFIYNYGKLLIDNSSFCNTKLSNPDVFGFIYNDYSLADIKISNSNFTNITTRQGVIFLLSGSSIDITNSTFENNIATVGSGAAIDTKSDKTTITNCSFIGNKANKNGGAIYTYSKTQILYSIFMNNEASYKNSMGYNGNSIYNLGELTIHYSIFLENGNNKIVYNNGEDDSFVNAQYNWWGTNDDPKNLVGAGSYYDDYDDEAESPDVDVSNWVLMSGSINPNENIDEKTPVTFTVDFNHFYNSNTNKIDDLTYKLPNGIVVNFISENGTFSDSSVKTINDAASSIYQPVKGLNVISAKSKDAIVTFNFTATGDSPDPKVYNLTNTTFFDYFDEWGNLKDFVVAGSTLNFYGEFSNLPGISSINIDRKLNINGVKVSLNNININLLSDKINIDNFKIIINGSSEITAAVIISGNDITISNSNISMVGGEDDSYAISIIESNSVILNNSYIYYEGHSSLKSDSIGIDISDSEDISLTNNVLIFNIPSAAVDYDAYYNSVVHVSGIKGINTNNLVIKDNSIDSIWNNEIAGSFDTIYTIYISGSDNVKIDGNKINSTGNSYLYPIAVLGYMDYNTYQYMDCKDFIINNNTIVSKANYAGYGIQIQVANGNVTNNKFNVESKNVTYAIYDEGSMGPLNVDYKNNTIYSKSNNVYGMSVSGIKENIYNNNISIEGNYTIGIFVGRASTDANIYYNNIISNATNIGTPAPYCQNVTAGIYLYKGNIYVEYNNITTSGIYSVDLIKNTKNYILYNYLVSKSLIGDNSVNYIGDNLVKYNYPNYDGIVYVSGNGSDKNNGSENAPVATIKKAIEIATAIGASGHIIIAEGEFKENDLTTNGNVIIEGAGLDKTIINGEYLKTIFTNSFGNLTLKDITLTNGKNSASSGGAIVNIGNLTLDNVKITDSEAIDNYNGGAIYSVGILNITNSIISNNKADTGGAIYADKSTVLDYDSALIINNSTFTNNIATSNDFGGGAIYMQVIDGTKLINNTVFDSNIANAGGAIFLQQSEGDFNIVNSQFVNNQIISSENTYGGGAINLIGETYSSVGNVLISGTSFINNSAKTSAGAIYDRNVKLDVSNSIFIDNFDGKNASIVRSVTPYYPSGANVYIDNNWWGNNQTNPDFDSSLLNNVNNPDLWLIMNMKADNSILYPNEMTSIVLDIRHNQKGDLIDGSKLPNKVPVQLIANNGKINNESIYLVNGVATFNYTAINSGNASITAKIYNKSVTINFNVIKYNSSIVVSSKDIILGEDAVIKATLSPNSTGNVTFTVNNKTYIVSIKDNVAELTLKNLDAGVYNVNAVYNGDNIYLSSSNSTSFNVINNKKTYLTGNNITMYYKDGTIFELKLVDYKFNPVANQNVTLVIDGVNYYRTTNENGSVLLPINLKAGTYEIYSYFNGTELYNSSSSINEVIVLSTISGNDIVKIYRNGTQYYAKFVNEDGSPLANTTVQFNIDGVFYNRVTDSNGVAMLNINLRPGKFIITATNPINGEMFSNNITVLSSISANDIVKYYRNGTQYYAKFVNEDGSPLANTTVQFNIDGVFYNRVTDSNGVAMLNINLRPGKFIITATNPINGEMFSNNIEVLPTLTANDLSMVQGDGSTFNAKLVDGQGKPLAGKEITFNIEGVFYNRITDDDGIAKLNINLRPGNFIITSMYMGYSTSNIIAVSKD